MPSPVPDTVADPVAAPLDPTAESGTRDGAGATERDTGGLGISAARRVRILLIAAIYSGLWAVLCTFVLELSVWSDQEAPPLWRLPVHNKALYVGALVLWLLILLVVCVTHRFWLSLGSVLALTLVVALVSHAKMQVRREPLYPSDIDFVTEPRFLWAMVEPWQVALLLVAVAVILYGSVRAGRLAERTFPRTRRSESPRWWWGLLVTRTVVALLCALSLLSASQFNQPGNPWRSAYEAQGAEWRFWYQVLNYRDNGFVGGFLYNTAVPAMQRPEGYSEQAMAEIAARYRASADRMSAGRSAEALEDTNVVVVLNEAFSDPGRLEGFELAEDPIARTRATMARTTAGTMLAQLYGGGTANMEFEALTGQSLALFEPQLNTPYQQLVHDHDTYPSVVGWLSRTHKPVAVHPYFTGMYKRNKVYETLGFEEFVHDTTMQRAERLEDSDFISDESAFDEVLHQVRSNDGPLLVNLVTMQNHVPMTGSYADPVAVAGLQDEDQAETIGSYARGLTYTDEALDRFLTSLEDSDERTVVIFYGDHQPGIYSEDLLADQNEPLARYRTEFLIWDSAGNAPDPQPLTSPIHFLPLAVEKLGAPLPPYYALLAELRREVPGMASGSFVTPDGETHTAEEQLSARARELLADYRMVQYDFSIGERYAVEDMWYPLPD